MMVAEPIVAESVAFIAIGPILLLLLLVLAFVATVTFVLAGPKLRKILLVASLVVVGGGGAIVLLGLLLLFFSRGSDLTKMSGGRNIAMDYQSSENSRSGSVELSYEARPSRSGTTIPISDEGKPSADEILAGMRVVSVRVDKIIGADHVRPADRVDVQVFARKNEKVGVPEDVTTTFVKDVTVFAVDAATDEGAKRELPPVRTISLLVTPPQAAKISLAEDIGSLRLVMRAASDKDVAKAGKEKKTDEPGDVPAWVGQSPKQSLGIYRQVLEVGPYSTVGECRDEMDKKLVAAAHDYLDEQVLHGDHRLMNVSSRYMRDQVKTDQYMKTETTNFGIEDGPLPEEGQTMHTLYYLLEFDVVVHDALARRARQATMESRLMYAGFGMVSVLALLASAFGYMRLDATTDGKYKRSLQCVAVTIVAAIAAGGWVLSQFVVLG